METAPSSNVHTTLMSLEAAATSARGGFACLFSPSDEYETALISGRRAQGHYDRRRSRWPAGKFVCGGVVVVGPGVLVDWGGIAVGGPGAPHGAFSFGP